MKDYAFKNMNFSNHASVSVIKDICKSAGRCIVHAFLNFFAHSDLQKCLNKNWWLIYVYENAQWCEKPWNIKRMSMHVDGGVMILLIWCSCVRHNFKQTVKLFNSWDCVRCIHVICHIRQLPLALIKNG